MWVEIFHVLAAVGGPPAQVLIDSSEVKAHRRASGAKGGERHQAIGRSRGGRTTKIHALTDAQCRPAMSTLGRYARRRDRRRLHRRRGIA